VRKDYLRVAIFKRHDLYHLLLDLVGVVDYAVLLSSKEEGSLETYKRRRPMDDTSFHSPPHFSEGTYFRRHHFLGPSYVNRYSWIDDDTRLLIGSRRSLATVPAVLVYDFVILFHSTTERVRTIERQRKKDQWRRSLQRLVRRHCVCALGSHVCQTVVFRVKLFWYPMNKPIVLSSNLVYNFLSLFYFIIVADPIV
jgi:hypothetical protein